MIDADGTLGPVYECDCSTWKDYGALSAFAYFLLVVFSLYLPVMCYRLIKANIPYGSREDPDKRLVGMGSGCIASHAHMLQL